MAVKNSDRKGYKSPDSYVEHFKKVVKSTGFQGPAVLTCTMTLLASGLSSGLHYSFLTPVPAEDHDLYTGILDQDQNYSYFNDGTFLIHNDEGYAMYRHFPQNEMILVLEDDREAVLTHMDGVLMWLDAQITYEERQITIDPFTEGRIEFNQCDYMSLPFTVGEDVLRYDSDDYHNRCDLMSGNVAERIDILTQEREFWLEAQAAISDPQTYYGEDMDNLTEPQVESRTKLAMETTGKVTGGVAGLFLLGAGMGAGFNRRKSIKSKGPKPS